MRIGAERPRQNRLARHIGTVGTQAPNPCADTPPQADIIAAVISTYQAEPSGRLTGLILKPQQSWLHRRFRSINVERHALPGPNAAGDRFGQRRSRASDHVDETARLTRIGAGVAAVTTPVAMAFTMSPGRKTKLAMAAWARDMPEIIDRPAIPKA